MSDLQEWKSAPIPVCLGGSVFGWLISARESEAVLDRFFEIGGRFIDTSDAYSYAQRSDGLDSESIIGGWAQRNGVADELRICTKVGLCPGLRDLRPETVRTAVLRSRDRLGVPMLEAVLAHADDETTPVEDIAGALSSVWGVDARHVGVCNFSADRLSATLAEGKRLGLAPLELIQEEFSLAARSFETSELGVLAESQNLALMCTVALAQGFLTGKFRNATERVGHRQRLVGERYSDARFDRILDTLQTVAAGQEVSMAAVALRWLIEHPRSALPVASVTAPSQLEAFRQASEISFSGADWSILESISASTRA